jgi:VanZ family protein
MFFNRTGYKRKKLPNKKNERKRSARIITGLSVLTIALTSWPRFHLEKSLDMEYTIWFDMLQHGGYYFVLGGVLFQLFPKKRYYEVILFFLLFGSLILEVLQLWIPGRDFTLLDIGSNYLGITLSFLLNLLIKYIKRNREHSIRIKTGKNIIN